MFNNYNLEHLKPEEVLAYFRKSRTDDPTLSVEDVLAKHEAILDEWAERNLGAKIPEENKYREVVSGETIADRPEIQRVLKLIESPKIKAILIVEVQRLSRGDLEDAGRLMKIIRYTNTLIITPMKIFNLTDEYDRDTFERELKRGNEYLEYQKKIMNRGRILSVSQGNYIGTYPPYGYDKVFIQEGKRKYPTLAINEDQANVVRMIFDMYVNQNMGYKTICDRLDSLNIPPQRRTHWMVPAVRIILQNVHYIGKVRWNYRKTVVVVDDGEVKKTNPAAKDGDYLIYDGKHPAIISDELFNAAQERFGKNPRVKSKAKVVNPLAGLVYCRCGQIMILRKHPGTNRMLCIDQTQCHTASCWHYEVMEMVATILKNKITEFEIEVQNNNDNSIKLHEKLIKNLEKKLDELQARELSQWEAQSDPDPAKRMPQHIFQMLNAKLVKEREDTEKALKEAYSTMPTQVDYEQKIVTLQSALDAMQDDKKSAAEKNVLLKKCIKRIEYYREPYRKMNGQGVKGSWGQTGIELDVELLV